MFPGWLASPSNAAYWSEQFLTAVAGPWEVTGPSPMQQMAPPKQPGQVASACISLVMGGFLPHGMACCRRITNVPPTHSTHS